jgi:hypothetical protein
MGVLNSHAPWIGTVLTLANCPTYFSDVLGAEEAFNEAGKVPHVVHQWNSVVYPGMYNDGPHASAREEARNAVELVRACSGKKPDKCD